MTALKEYDRLESGGLWKSGPDAQRRDVVLSFGNATLVIADSAARPITHWSLAALERLNPGTRPALFAPDPEASETLEIEDAHMIDALEKVRRTVVRSRPKPGRLRQIMTWGSVALVVGLAVFWLPGALQNQALAVVPAVKRAEIGASLLGHIQRLTGPTCRGPLGAQALAALQTRLFGTTVQGQILVASADIEGAIALPGGIVVIGRDLVETYDDPAVIAGFTLAAATQAGLRDPLAELLEGAGFLATLRLLSTGEVPPEQIQAHAANLIAAAGVRPADDDLLAAFARSALPSSPYAYAIDPTGETTLALIEADPMAGQQFPIILNDADWISLQGICTD